MRAFAPTKGREIIAGSSPFLDCGVVIVTDVVEKRETRSEEKPVSRAEEYKFSQAEERIRTVHRRRLLLRFVPLNNSIAE